MTRATRLIELLALLSGRRERTAAELAAHFGLSQRSLFRDLSELSSRYPIVRGERGWRLLDGATPRILHLDTSERAVLRLALSNQALRREPALGRALEALTAKLEALDALSDEDPVVLLAGPERTGEIAAGIVSQIEDGARTRSTLKIRYTSLTTPGQRDRLVDPYGTFHRQGVWYCAGHCHINNEMRIFRLDRISKARPAGTHFDDPGIDLNEYLANSWNVFRGTALHEIRLWIDAELAPLARSGALHPGAEVKELAEDGWGAIEYRLRLSHLEEIARWIVGFGGRVRVLSPSELQTRVQDIARQVLDGSETNRSRSRNQ